MLEAGDADVPAIREVNRLAFGQGEEADLVDALRAHGAVVLSLVATLSDRVVGHVLYSPVTVGGRVTGAGLGPMAVHPDHQRAGVGSKLVEAGNRRLEKDGCPVIVVLGHPAFYPRFGFTPASAHGIRWRVSPAPQSTAPNSRWAPESEG